MAVADNEIEPTTKKVFSEPIGGRHLLICNLITDAIDPISGKTCNNFVVQVLDKINPDEPLGEKKFVWPEDDLPEFTIEQKPNLTLLMKGKRNIAQLPFYIPRHILPKLPENSKFIPPIAFRTNFNGPTERVDNSQGLIHFAREFATKLDEERWKMLVQKCSSDDLPKPLPFISADSLSDDEQLQLINALQKKVKTKAQEGQVIMVFNVLLKQRVFTASAFRELLKSLIAQQYCVFCAGNSTTMTFGKIPDK
uniref:Uncharacterized protein n=1 Tax=Panagrolaimus sp. JU765 TaxID=591449 RepID=A0AC34QU89_9BILA